MAFYGKEFTLQSHENFDKFVQTFKVPDNVKQAMINHKDTIKLSKNGDKYTIVISTPAGEYKEVTFSSGVAFDEDVHGMKIRNTFTVNGNVVTQEMVFPDSKVTIIREYSADQLVATYKIGDSTVAKKIYK